MELEDILKIFPKINCIQKFACYKTHKNHLSQIAWMYPEEFLEIQGKIQSDEIKWSSYMHQAVDLVYNGVALDVPQICLGSNHPTHDGRHRVFSFYKNCEKHKIPVWIFGTNESDSPFDYTIPEDVLLEKISEGYVIFKIPTGVNIDKRG